VPVLKRTLRKMMEAMAVLPPKRRPLPRHKLKLRRRPRLKLLLNNAPMLIMKRLKRREGPRKRREDRSKLRKRRLNV
jgi:hypothetical protein